MSDKEMLLNCNEEVMDIDFNEENDDFAQTIIRPIIYKTK